MTMQRNSQVPATAPGEPDERAAKAAVVEPGRADRQRDSLSENFNAEIYTWARMAMVRNGFGDLPG